MRNRIRPDLHVVWVLSRPSSGLRRVMGMRLLRVRLGGMTVAGPIALAIWLISTGAPLKVSVPLLVSAALLTASAVGWQGKGTRALASACVWVGRPAGSAYQRAAL